MRVLIAHNRYRTDAPSGENRVVDTEIAELRRRGVEVSTFTPSSDDIGGPASYVRSALAPILPANWLGGLARRLDAESPEVLHLHNLYPLVPPGLIDLALERRIPVIASLHNARFFCMKGTMARNGHSCLLCLERDNPVPGIVHACYRASRPQSVVMAAALVRNRPRILRATRYLAVSDFLRQRLVAAGLPSGDVFVKPNGVADPGTAPPPGPDVLYIGRLDHEKGIAVLLDAWERAMPVGRRLRIVGGGLLEAEVRRRAEALDGVDFLGVQSAEGVQQELRVAGVVVVPSQVPETFGLTAVEAFAAGRPVIATRTGALPEIVDDSTGWLVDGVESLTQVLRGLTPADISTRGESARTRFLSRYTLSASTDLLLSHYDEIAGRQALSPPPRT